ncbi:MAG TPA: hypothetical protein VMT45_07800 [Thermoanaerobaculaceae bacterium]|nr:hypothetical protein [Thermoanaerobaculaceae bacterium]
MRGRLRLAVAIVVLAIVALWVGRQRWRPVPEAPMARPTPAETARPAAPAPASTPIPEPLEERHSTVIVPWAPEPTPSPTPEREPTARPRASRAPRVDECVLLTYSAGVLPGTLGQILVDIRLENHCGRDLGPLDVWFWVGGFRQGDLVQSVRGHPFDPIARGEEGKASIVLPGSIDWYDRIDARVIAPGTP